MGRRKKHEEHVNHERWLISYADFITLLFAFFVVMFSASQVDQRRLGAFSESFAGAVGATVVPRGSDGLMVATTNTPPPRSEPRTVTNPRVVFSLENLSEALHDVLSSNPGMESVRVIRRHNDFVLRMPDHVFFESGDTSVKDLAKVILTTLARSLGAFPIDMRVEGHTDRNPIRTARYRSNWELSTARATSVLQLLAGTGFPPDHLSASGYGEFHPVATNDDDDGRQQNRRVDIVVSIHNTENDTSTDSDAAVDPLTAITAAVAVADGSTNESTETTDASVTGPTPTGEVAPPGEVAAPAEIGHPGEAAPTAPPAPAH